MAAKKKTTARGGLVGPLEQLFYKVKDLTDRVTDIEGRAPSPERVAALFEKAVRPVQDHLETQQGRLAERVMDMDRQLRQLEYRFNRLETILERIGKAALQENP